MWGYQNFVSNYEEMQHSFFVPTATCEGCFEGIRKLLAESAFKLVKYDVDRKMMDLSIPRAEGWEAQLSTKDAIEFMKNKSNHRILSMTILQANFVEKLSFVKTEQQVKNVEALLLYPPLKLSAFLEANPQKSQDDLLTELFDPAQPTGSNKRPRTGK